MRIGICDDEKEIRHTFAEKIRRIYPKAELEQYPSGEELLSADRMPDILLLDIRMPGRDGMETAKKLREKGGETVIIFVTALEDFVFQAFDVGAFHYLVKPFDDNKFREVLSRAVGQVEGRERAESTESRQEKPRLIVTAGGKHVSVNLEDIVYAEVFDRKVIVHTMDADIEYYGKMKELEKQAGEELYRPHRAYLINFNYIVKYDASNIYLKRGQVLMARQNYREFVQRYLRYNQRKGQEYMEQGGIWWKAVSYGLPVSEIVLMGYCLYRLTAPFMERKKGALRAGMAYVLVMGGIYVLFLRLEGLSLRRMMGALAVFLVMCRTDRRNYGQKAFLVQTFSRCTGSPGRWRKWYTIICIILSEIQTI